MSLDRSLLRNMAVFGALSDEALKFVLDRCKQTTRDEGEFFFRESDNASALYVLQKGNVEVVRQHEGRHFHLAELGPGDCFGEMALIERAPRSAAVRALNPCSALEIGLDVLHALYHHDVEQFVLVQMNLAREMSRRLRESLDKFFDAKLVASEMGGDYRWYLV